MDLLRLLCPAVLACVAFTSSGCGKQPASGPNPADSIPRDRSVDAVAPSAAPLPARAAPYIAVNELRRALLPLGPTMGEVAVEQGCVVFRHRGQSLTPLWPYGTKLEAEGAGWAIRLADGKRISIPSRVTLTGAETALNREGMTKLTGAIAEGCPPSIYAVTLN